MKHIIVTRSGKLIEFGNVRVTDIDINDIAHSLANLCRFTGHCSQFYSVATHSILCSRLLDGTPQEKMQALLHDAPEAYINDLSSPLKAFIRGRYMEEHDRLEKVIAKKFNLPCLMSDKVKVVDWAAFLIEWSKLFPHVSKEESLKLGIDIDSFNKPDLLHTEAHLFATQDPGDVVADFLDEYEKLELEIQMDEQAMLER